MTPEESEKAVGGYAVARYAHGGGEHGRGRVVSYSMVPTLTIETADGTRFSWRHDLCERITEPAWWADAVALHASDKGRAHGGRREACASEECLRRA